MLRKSFLMLSLASLLSAACGDDDGSGAGPDAAPTPDAAPRPDGAVAAGACSITIGHSVVSFGGPVPINANVNYGGPPPELPPLDGYTVLFNAPDGSLLGTATTDVAGRAEFAECVGDTTISVVITPPPLMTGGPIMVPPQVLIASYANVQPGDDAILGWNFVDGEGSLNATLNITVSTDFSLFEDAASVDVLIGCTGAGTYFGPGNTPGNFVLGVWDSCLGSDGTVDVFARLYSDNGGQVGYAFLTGVAVTDGMETPVTLPAWTPGNLETAVIAANLPVQKQWGFAGVSFGRDGQYFGNASAWIDSSDLTASGVGQGLPADFADMVQGSSYLQLECSSIGTSSELLRWLPTGQDTYLIDWSEAISPLDVVFVTRPGGRPTLNWVGSGDLSAANYGSFGALFVGEGLFAAWAVVTSNPGAGSFAAPELPESLAPLLDSIDFTVPIFGAVGDLGSAATYADIITGASFTPGDSVPDPLWDAMPEAPASANFTFWQSECDN